MQSRLFKKYRYSLILLRELVITEFKLRYQGSVLGYVWSLLRPLFMFVILYLVFVYFLKIGSNIPHWPVALLLGIVLWNFFTEITNNGLTAIVDRGDVIRKINFPKYVIILASSISAFINLLINALVIIVFMIFSHVSISWWALLSPLYIIEMFAFGLGLAFILGALFVKLRDVNYIWEVITQALFYASAIMYPISLVITKSHIAATILLLNPITQSVQDIRHMLISPANPTLYEVAGKSVWVYTIPLLIVVLVVLVGGWYFKKQSPHFAENV